MMKKNYIFAIIILLAAVLLVPMIGVKQAQASEPFIGEIRIVGFGFAPRGWAFCDGQLLQIAQNTALFSLLGTTFGGDGRVTFGLPDLRGRVAIHPGTGPGLSQYRWGERGGVETVTLTTAQIPAHNHSLNATDTIGNSENPGGNYHAKKSRDKDFYAGTPTTTTMHAGSIGNAGGGQPHPNIQPFLGVYHTIALVGIFPSRN